MNWHTTLGTDPEGRQTIQNQYPGITSYPHHMYFSWPIGNYRPYVLLRTYNNPNNVFSSWSYKSNADHAIKYPCLPVVYCSPASIPPFMEDYSIHTTHFHIPQSLPLTTVLIIYRSIFESMQHLTYRYNSSRPWCYWQFLWSFNVLEYFIQQCWAFFFQFLFWGLFSSCTGMQQQQ